MTVLLLTAAVLLAPSRPADTVRFEVGSPGIDGRVYQPHRARVRVHLGSLDTPPTNEWINELTIGDSAGRPVMRWSTTGQFDKATGEAGYRLLQTYDHITMAPLGYSMTHRNGARMRLTIDGTRVRGTRRVPGDTADSHVDQDVGRIGFIASASDLVPLAAGLKQGAVYIAPVWGPNMQQAESRIFTVARKERMMIEGSPWEPWIVEERRESDRKLLALWYLVDRSPYMVGGEVYLPNGQVQKMTEVALP